MRLLRVLFALVAFVLAQPVLAQGGPPSGVGGASPVADLQLQVDALAARVLILESLLASHEGDAAAHHPQYTDAEAVAATDPDDVLGVMSRVGNDIFIDSANLHVRNGGGITDGANGFGNIIIGYNELRGDATDDRSGSHMLVLGSGNNFTSFGGVVSGELNSTEAPFSSIIGGDGNSTFSVMDFTGGFTKNMAIIGGRQNIAVGTGGVAVGGFQNDVTVDGGAAVLAGGRDNSAQFGNTFIGGGRSNITLGFNSAILGGRDNITGILGTFNVASYSSISGGRDNATTNAYASISGGRDNIANGFVSSISGGRTNTTDGSYSSISGGNTASAPATFDHPDTHTP